MPTDIFDKINQLHVVVIGDVMLDNYNWGDVERLSPEAPVPVVSIRKTESRLGGAANVAVNCKMLGAKVTLATVIGNDHEGTTLRSLLEAKEIDLALLQTSEARKTTSKTRILSRNQQMLRLDAEITDDLNIEDEHAFIDAVMRYLQIHKPQVVIFEDYNKGVLKENVIEKIIGHCKKLNILIAVDPKKKNFLTYRGVDIFKPNLKEVKEGLDFSPAELNRETLDELHSKLKEQLQHQVSFITLSEMGVYYHCDSHSELITSHRRSIADVSGAGDTVIAVAALVYAVSKDAHLMAAYSNIAGGLVCEEVGVVPINKAKLIAEIERLNRNATVEPT
jgi:rfaE bifunctional protein kinase chain/domain